MKNPLAGKNRNPLFLRNEELEKAVALMANCDFGMATAMVTTPLPPAVSSTSIRLILLIYFHGKAGTKTLRERLKLPKQTLSNQLKELIARGFAVGTVDPQDQRKTILSLTDQGEAIARAVVDRQKTMIRRAFSDAGPEAVAGFTVVLENLAASMNSQHRNVSRR